METGWMTVLAAGLVCAATAGGTAVAVETRTFSDPVGDAAAGFDVANVTVSNDDAGQITFRVGLTAVPALPPSLNLLLVLDSDAKPSTGANGVDHYVAVSGGVAGVATAAGPFRAAPSLSFNFLPGVTNVSVNRRELGNTRTFRFRVLTIPTAPDGSLDSANADPAPDADWWSFGLRLPTRLVVASRTLAPNRPRPGRVFSARMVVRDVTYGAPGSPVTRGTVACAFSAGGARVAATGAVRGGGVVTCTGRVPEGAATGSVRGTMRYRLDGVSVTRGFASSPFGGDVRKGG